MIDFKVEKDESGVKISEIPQKKPTGGPAFPQLGIESGERDGHGDMIEPITASKGGMSLRDWFATNMHDFSENGISRLQAVAVMDKEPPLWGDGDDLACVKYWAEADALLRFIKADAMMKARGS